MMRTLYVEGKTLPLFIDQLQQWKRSTQLTLHELSPSTRVTCVTDGKGPMGFGTTYLKLTSPQLWHVCMTQQACALQGITDS